MRNNKRDEGKKGVGLEVGGVVWYRKKIVEVTSLIEDEQLLKRIYELAKYLHIYK